MSKKTVIEEMQKYLEDKFNSTIKDNNLNIQERLGDADIYWNIKKILDNYDENIDILKKVRLSNKFNSKSRPSERDFGDDDKYNY